MSKLPKSKKAAGTSAAEQLKRLRVRSKRAALAISLAGGLNEVQDVILDLSYKVRHLGYGEVADKLYEVTEGEWLHDGGGNVETGESPYEGI